MTNLYTDLREYIIDTEESVCCRSHSEPMQYAQFPSCVHSSHDRAVALLERIRQEEAGAKKTEAYQKLLIEEFAALIESEGF